MANEKRLDLIDRQDLIKAVQNKQFALSDNTHPYKAVEIQGKYFREVVDNAPTVDAVEVALIKEFKQNILETLDNLIAVDEPLANDTAPSSSYYRGKVNAYEVARRLVNAAMTDLCDNCGAKTDGGNDDGTAQV